MRTIQARFSSDDEEKLKDIYRYSGVTGDNDSERLGDFLKLCSPQLNNYRKA